MARCNIEGCVWWGKKAGLKIHQFRVHNIRAKHEDFSSSVSASQLCPVPGCGVAVDDLLPHLIESHESWRLSSGKFVFEVGP